MYIRYVCTLCSFTMLKSSQFKENNNYIICIFYDVCIQYVKLLYRIYYIIYYVVLKSLLYCTYVRIVHISIIKKYKITKRSHYYNYEFSSSPGILYTYRTWTCHIFIAYNYNINIFTILYNLLSAIY
jgi:hypothetical protein